MSAIEGSPSRVLLSVSEPATARSLARAFLRAGFSVIGRDGPVRRADADLLVVDTSSARSARATAHLLRSGCSIPVLVVTAHAGAFDRCAMFDAGADDVVAASTPPTEVVLRARSILRRDRRRAAGVAARSTIEVGPVVLDVDGRHVRVAGREVALTRIEFDLLLFFVTHPGVALSRDELFEQVWGYTIGDRATVTVHVRRLREKIEPDPGRPQLVRTVWGIGYCFAADG